MDGTVGICPPPPSVQVDWRDANGDIDGVMSDDWEDYEADFDEGAERRTKKKPRRSGTADTALAVIPEGAIDERRDGRVASITRLDVTLVTAEGIVETPPAREPNGEAIRLAIGDEVVAARRGDAWKIELVQPRRSRLSRPQPHDPTVERTFAANVDIAILVLSIRQPPLRAGLADRFVVSCQRGNVEPAIVVNKSDLAPDEDPEELHRYRAMGLHVIRTSVKTGDGLDQLAGVIRGRTCVLVGHSGVGKSSMLAALLERFGGGVDHTIRTGEVNRKVGMGRHTTTASTLYDLGASTWIIDTPGVRQFGLWDLTPQLLSASFPEFDDFSPSCRYNDCTHSHEPDCAVQKAVDEGEIEEARYETYLRLLAEL